jgi:hypothetical protein
VPRSRDLLGEDRAASAWLLTQDDLDRLPQVHRDPGDGNGDRIVEPITAAAVPPDDDEDGTAYGALCDELQSTRRAVELNLRDLARVTDERDDARRMLVDAQRSLAEQQPSAPVEVLRREVEDQTTRAERAEAELARARARWKIVERGNPHPPFEAHLAGAATVTCDGRELLVTYEAAQATTAQTGEPLSPGARRVHSTGTPADRTSTTTPMTE